jgi:hypothetical protein
MHVLRYDRQLHSVYFRMINRAVSWRDKIFISCNLYKLWFINSHQTNVSAWYLFIATPECWRGVNAKLRVMGQNWAWFRSLVQTLQRCDALRLIRIEMQLDELLYPRNCVWREKLITLNIRWILMHFLGPLCRGSWTSKNKLYSRYFILCHLRSVVPAWFAWYIILPLEWKVESKRKIRWSVSTLVRLLVAVEGIIPDVGLYISQYLYSLAWLQTVNAVFFRARLAYIHCCLEQTLFCCWCWCGCYFSVILWH